MNAEGGEGWGAEMLRSILIPFPQQNYDSVNDVNTPCWGGGIARMEERMWPGRRNAFTDERSEA